MATLENMDLVLTNIEEEVNKNFTDMDFDNCNLRDSMEGYVNEIIAICEEMKIYCNEEKGKLR